MEQQITLNGSPVRVEKGATLYQLLQAHGVNVRRVAVELNRRILPRAEFGETPLRDGDEVEVVTFVGGG